MFYIISLLCLAVAMKLCVILAHDDYICIENPECFTLLLKQQEHLAEAVKHQLETQDRMLQLQAKQLQVLSDLAASSTSSASITDTLIRSLLSSLLYLLVLGFLVSVLPWLFRKYTELRKSWNEDQVNRHSPAARQRLKWCFYGSGQNSSDETVEVNQESIPLTDIRMGPIGVIQQTADGTNVLSVV